MSEPRLVAVFGYSDGTANGRLHPICAARLAQAANEVQRGDAVLFSGWTRRRGPDSEAEVMARAWNGRSARVLLDRDARSTYGNAVGAAAAARALGVRDVVLVTSGWHGRRASALLRAGLHRTEHRVSVVATDERGTRRARLRELACWTLVPVQAVFAAGKR